MGRDVNAFTKLAQSSSAALRLVLAALLVALTGAGAHALNSRKTVTLDVDGSTVAVSTMKSRVVDIVEEHGLDVGDVLQGRCACAAAGKHSDNDLAGVG